MGPHEENDSVVQEWSGSELVISSNDQNNQRDSLDLAGHTREAGNSTNEWTSPESRVYPSHRVTNTRSTLSSESLLGFQSYQISRTRWGRTLRTRSNRYHLQEKERQKRHVLQDMARPLKQWLIRHRGHPYPSKLEKIALALGSQMTLVQVSNWFANARRRLKNTVRGQGLTWSQRVRMYNSYVSGNAETLSIDSDDSIWDSDSEEEREKTLVEDIRPGGDRSSQRSYNEHEEHSYFSSVPLTNKDREAPKCRKRTRVSNSDNTSPDEESENGTTSAKRSKTRCRTGDRFMRCIHHVYPGNVVFQNGSSANECVKVSPWQKSDDENSGLAAESSSSAVSSDEFEDDKRVNKKEYCNFRGNQTEEDDIRAITHSTDFSRSDTCVESLGASGFSKFPKKYKSAILHRYLSDFTDTRRKARKRPHSQIRGDSPKFESYTDEIEIKISNKRKRRESEATATTTECSEIKRPRLITCDRKNFGEYKSFSTKEREYSELEAAEVLTNLSRSTNIYKHTHTKKSPSESFIN